MRSRRCAGTLRVADPGGKVRSTHNLVRHGHSPFSMVAAVEPLMRQIAQGADAGIGGCLRAGWPKCGSTSSASGARHVLLGAGLSNFSGSLHLGARNREAYAALALTWHGRGDGRALRLALKNCYDRCATSGRKFAAPVFEAPQICR
jgi:hypothetical protein